jgi:hypothetical protein
MQNFSLADVNFLAVLVASLLYYFLGALWYSPVLFGPTWVKLVGLDMSDPNKKKGMWKLMLFTFINTLITSFVMSLYGAGMGANTFVAGLCLGASTAVGFMVTTITTTFLYEGKPTKLYFIDIGYHFVGFLIAGVVLSVWR